ncbi:MAG TPA: pentapeptide repeat-containing protein [Micromonosporaceae bacterium]|nr:pentapeptide repeat-containing protein [Micromonosporaceae bacterium]
MAVRSVRRSLRPRPPVEPSLPACLDEATVFEHDLTDEASYEQLDFSNLDLSHRSADLVRLEACRFINTDLADTVLDRMRLIDCLLKNGNLANLRATGSTMLRVRLSALRLTGLQWIDGKLRDVTFEDCRADLSSFRFTGFADVVFNGCNLTGADFANADLSGTRFINCDLTNAQFSHAKADGVRFSRCTLIGIGGVASLSGATIDDHDLITLSYTLASALGIHIDTGNDR